jgi:hypothetical protein
VLAPAVLAFTTRLVRTPDTFGYMVLVTFLNKNFK